MRFKEWLMEQQSVDKIDNTMAKNPAQANQVLRKAINQTSKMPETQKLTTAPVNNRSQYQKTALDIAQQAMKTHPLWNKVPSVTAPFIANGLIDQFGGGKVPEIGSSYVGPKA